MRYFRRSYQFRLFQNDLACLAPEPSVHRFSCYAAEALRNHPEYTGPQARQGSAGRALLGSGRRW